MKRQSGFSPVESLLVIVAVFIVAFTGWFVWHSVNNTKKTNDQTVSDSSPPQSSGNRITTYDECTKASGSKIQETYPQICVTKDGKHFTQDTSEGSKTSSYLIVKEWGVKIPLSTNTMDAYYEKDDNGMMYISTKKLHSLVQQVGGCHAGLDDVFLARSANGNDLNIKSNWHVKIGNYYYFRGHTIEPLCATRTDENLAKQYQPIQSNLESEIQKIVAD